jgi:hypothetical protein
MFADAFDTARLFTLPLFQAFRFHDGTTQGGIASCVFINRDGWFLTAAHLFDALMTIPKHAQEMAVHAAAEAAIKSHPKYKSGDRHRELRKLKPNKRWLTHQSLVMPFGPIVEWQASRDIDLAVCRVEPFDPTLIQAYAKFKNPGSLRTGTSLCRLGFPFLDVGCSFDKDQNSFTITPPASITFFPNEGIYTREHIGPKSPNGSFSVRFVETSSPGLIGQSGGPVFDSKGIVWGIQCDTLSIPLGINPKHKLDDGKEVDVYQYVNVGRAVHPLTIQEFLNHHNVLFEQEN